VASIKHIFNEIHYEMTRKLAEGGMGVVYEALQLGAGNFKKVVAVKLIREEFSAIEEFQKNFIGEARLVADLIHTNIVQTYHLGQIGGQYFMVMEFVRGVNLEVFIEKHRALGRPIPLDLAAFIISRIARGLAYAHQKCDRDGRHLNIVHRDIGPKNVLLAFEGDVKLTDFGIAKALDLMYNEEGKVIAGKDEYLSPEQANYAVTDARADLFPLGIVLTELLLGKNLFRAIDRAQSRRNILGLPSSRRSSRRPSSATATTATSPRLRCSRIWKCTFTVTDMVRPTRSLVSTSRNSLASVTPAAPHFPPYPRFPSSDESRQPSSSS
jgi:serine/threonine protein kinase